MSIVASARNSKHLADTAEHTNLELASNDVPLGPAEVRSGAGIDSQNSRLWNDANFSEMNQSESLYFRRRWRWPLSYRSIEVIAIFVDTLIIVAAGVLADAAYHLTMTALPTEITIYGGAGAVVAALLTCVLKDVITCAETALPPSNLIMLFCIGVKPGMAWLGLSHRWPAPG